jgi:hypothetical protein
MKSTKELAMETEDLEWVANRVAELLQGKLHAQNDPWINEEKAMIMLNVSSKTTMLRLRNEGAIRFSQPYKKIIVYDRNSILAFLERYAKNTF